MVQASNQINNDLNTIKQGAADSPRGPHEATISSSVTPADPPRGPYEATISGGVTPTPWSPSQRLVFRMLPKNVPIPPSGPSPHMPPRTVKTSRYLVLLGFLSKNTAMSSYLLNRRSSNSTTRSFSTTISSAIFIGDKLPGSTLSYHDLTKVVSKQPPSPPPGRKPSSSPSHELSIQHARMDPLKPKSYNPNKEEENYTDTNSTIYSADSPTGRRRELEKL
ncbi:hypothetical protein Bca101_024718 [Brassica carinata]